MANTENGSGPLTRRMASQISQTEQPQLSADTASTTEAVSNINPESRMIPGTECISTLLESTPSNQTSKVNNSLAQPILRSQTYLDSLVSTTLIENLLQYTIRCLVMSQKIHLTY